MRKITKTGSQFSAGVNPLKTSVLLARPHAPAPKVMITPAKKLNPILFAIVLADLLVPFITIIAIVIRTTPKAIVILALSMEGDYTIGFIILLERKPKVYVLTKKEHIMAVVSENITIRMKNQLHLNISLIAKKMRSPPINLDPIP